MRSPSRCSGQQIWGRCRILPEDGAERLLEESLEGPWSWWQVHGGYWNWRLGLDHTTG